MVSKLCRVCAAGAWAHAAPAESVEAAAVVRAGLRRPRRCFAMRASFSCGAAAVLVPPWAEAVRAACSKRLMRFRVEPQDGGELMFVFAAAGGGVVNPLT